MWHHNLLGEEIGTDGGLVLVVELAVHVPAITQQEASVSTKGLSWIARPGRGSSHVHQGSLSNTAVTQDNNLEQNLLPCAATACHDRVTSYQILDDCVRLFGLGLLVSFRGMIRESRFWIARLLGHSEKVSKHRLPVN